MVPRAKMLNILTNLLLLIAYILVSTGFNELDDKCSVCVHVHFTTVTRYEFTSHHRRR
jgi:hypothetical protein